MSRAYPHPEVGAVIICIDGRPHFNDYKIATLEKEPVFTLDAAGGALTLLEDISRDWMLAQIDACFEITDTCKFVRLISHLGCGKYSLSGITFASEEKEVARKWEDLHEAEKTIKESLPNREIEVELVLLDLDANEVPDPIAA